MYLIHHDLLRSSGCRFLKQTPRPFLISNPVAARCLDAQGRRAVAHEFDAEFRCLGEIRAHIAEWEGDQAYFTEYSGH